MPSLPTILLILAAVSIGATVIAILVAIRSAREARSAIFPIVREEETVRARRARVATFFLSAITALFLGGWLATLRLPQLDSSTPVTNIQPSQPVATTTVVFATITPVPAISTSPTPVNSVAEAVQPTQAVLVNTPVAFPPSPTPPPPPSIEPTFLPATEASVMAISPAPASPTPSPIPPTANPLPPTSSPLPPTAAPISTPIPEPPLATPTLEATTAGPIPTTGPRTPAPSGVSLGPIQFALSITPDIEAVSPRYLFPEGTKSVYAVFPYSGMVDGVNFAVVWYQNGVELWRDEQVWRWGREAQFYSFLNPPGEGLYKLELYVNDTVAASGIFEIR